MQTEVLSDQKSEHKISLFEGVTSVQPMKMPDLPHELILFNQWKESEEYKRLSFDEKIREIKKFYEQSFIGDYLEEKWKAQLYNRDSILWLVAYREQYMDKTNEKESFAIQMKLNQFLEVIGSQDNIYPQLRINLSALNVQKQSNKIDWEE